MAPTCRRPIRREEANIILKLHSFFSKEKESGSPILMNRPRERICQAVDISQRSLTRILAGVPMTVAGICALSAPEPSSVKHFSIPLDTRVY